MNRASAKNPLVQAVAKLAFAVFVCATVARLVYLAKPPQPATAPMATIAAHPVADIKPSQSANLPTAADAELAQLYGMCPMAATVDLKTVVESPETIDAILPPYQSSHLAPRDETPPSVSQSTTPQSVALPPHALTTDRHPQAPVESAVPRIRYPLIVRPSSPIEHAPAESMRVAQRPANESATTASSGDWLVDPKDWFIPGEGNSAPALPAETQDVTGNATNEVPQITIDPPSPANVPSPVIEPASPEQRQSTETVAPQADDLTLPPANNTYPPATPIEEPPTPAPQPPAPDTPSPPAAIFSAPPAPTNAPATTTPTPSPQPPVPDTQSPAPGSAVDPHLELFAKNQYPSARECAKCHEDIYHEWSVSAHAYAAVSPMFHKFEQRLNDLSQGTVGYFCMRCHAPIATALCQSRAEPLWNMPEVAREGITCIACHRVQYIYGKSNGERHINPGDVFAPVFGGIGGEGVAETVHRKDHFKVKTSPDEKGPGQDMHAAGIYFDPLTRSEFCTPCHQVAVHPGIKLEVVWEQYRASPACKKGIQCQDCHMGRVPGLPLGYNTGPVAKIADKTVNDHRKKSNHIFYGPNYSIAHPGIFPFHLKANRWTMQEWLTFDWRAGWGTKEFEDRVADGLVHCVFPPCWAEADDRYDAREIIDDNLKKLNHKRELRIEVMENGSHVEGPFFKHTPRRGQDLKFHYVVTNTNEGHNLLTASLGAQPQYWANVVLTGPDGRRIWETGYLDSFGDLANIHSEDVRHKRLPYDAQLFNLQTMFLITGAKGTDREFFIPVNVDIDQLPFIRPGVQPISVINHPPFIRMESQSLAPLGSRRAEYFVPGEVICQPGTYRLSFRMRSRAEPPYFMRFCNATPDMIRAMNEWMVDVHPMTVEFTVP